MLTKIGDLPAGVIGFEVAGKLRAEDYRDTLQPELGKAAANGEVRVVIVIPEFEGFSGGASGRTSSPGSNTGAPGSASLSSRMSSGWSTEPNGSDGSTPGEVKHFPLAERSAVIAWAAGEITTPLMSRPIRRTHCPRTAGC